MITKIYRSFTFAFNGLKTAWREEYNFRVEVLLAIILVFLIFYFEFSFIESIFSLIAIIWVLFAEIVNTAIEDICNKIEPQHDSIIGKIKDTMAASVLISVSGAVVIVVSVFYHHFFI
jgi:diacylglycerol kinase